MAESVTGGNSSDNVHMQTVSRGRWDGVNINEGTEKIRKWITHCLRSVVKENWW